jgi:ketosteroid isomerase-like protein
LTNTHRERWFRLVGEATKFAAEVLGGALSMSLRRTVLAAVLAFVAVTPAFADDAAKEVEAKMREYFTVWNQHDAAAVATRIYRLDNTANGAGTQANFQAQFDSLKAQGYDHSELKSIDTCLIGPNLALAWMRYSRIKTDGTAMPPKDRATLYKLRKTADGWRIAELLGGDATGDFSCKSPTAAPARAGR